RLFHNLRSSRQTELAQDNPSYLVCAWIGNTEDVAQDHYLQILPEHFQKAAGKAAQILAQHGPETAGTRGKSEKANVTKRTANTADCVKTHISTNEAIAAGGLEPPTQGL